MARKDPQFQLRMPIDVKQSIEKASKNNNRSINSEIVDRLKETLVQDELFDSYSTSTTIAKGWYQHLDLQATGHERILTDLEIAEFTKKIDTKRRSEEESRKNEIREVIQEFLDVMNEEKLGKS